MGGGRRASDRRRESGSDPLTFKARVVKLTNVFTSETVEDKPVLHPPITYKATVELPLPRSIAAPPESKMIEVTTYPLNEKFQKQSRLNPILGWPTYWVNPRTETITKVWFKPSAGEQLGIPRLRGESLASPGYTIVRLRSTDPFIVLVTEDQSIGPTEITEGNASALTNLERIAELFLAHGGFGSDGESPETGPEAG